MRAAAFGVALLAAYSLIEGWLFDFHEAGGHFVWPQRGTLSGIPAWLGWLALIPFGLRYFRSHPYDSRHPFSTVRRYTVAGFAFAMVHGFITVPISFWILDAPPPVRYGEALRIVWWSLLRAPGALLQWMAFASVYHAVVLARGSADREAAASRLTAALAEAELNALKMQLEPHFLFNTLNSILAFVESNPSLASRLVTLLSRLLRSVLELRGEQEVTIARELAFVRDYLEIQQLRFGQRLGVSVEADAEVAQAAVPVMLLQPIVENALEHSVGRHSAHAKLVVRAERVADDLCIEVRDSAVTPPEISRGVSPVVGMGVGLGSIRARLAQLYPGRAHIDLATAPTGSCVMVRMPFRRLDGQRWLAHE